MAVHFLFQMWRFSLFQGRSVVFGWECRLKTPGQSPLCLDASDQTWMCCLHRWNSWNISSLGWFKVFKVSPAECCKLNGTESTSLILWLIAVVYRVGSSGCKSNTQTLTGQCRTTCAFPSGRKGPRWAEALLIIIGDRCSHIFHCRRSGMCCNSQQPTVLIRSGTQFDPNEKSLDVKGKNCIVREVMWWCPSPSRPLPSTHSLERLALAGLGGLKTGSLNVQHGSEITVKKN